MGITAVTIAVQLSRSRIVRFAQRRSITARTRRRSKKTKGQKLQKDHKKDKTCVSQLPPTESSGSEASPQAIFEAVAIMESPLECHLDAFRSCLSQMSVKKCLDLDLPENSILRLALLEQIGVKGGYKAWSSLPKRFGVLKTLGEAAEASWVPHSRNVEIDITAMGISILNILGEERVETQQNSGAELSSNQILAMYRCFAEALPCSFLRVVIEQLNHPSLDPIQVHEEEILSIALAAEAEGFASVVWERLAGLLMRRWSKLSKRALLESMLVLPELLLQAPGELQEALLEQCQKNQVLVGLSFRSFTWLLDSWGSQSRSPLFPVLLRPALDWHLSDLDVRRLVLVSKIFDAFDAPEAGAEVVLLWQTWAENLSADCKVKSWRWSVFQEALREVSGSQHLRRKTEMSAMSASTSLGDMIMEGVLFAELLRHARALPMDLLLELLRQMPSAREELAADLPDLVWHFLDGRGGGLSLLNAMKIAQGEAFIKCEPNSELWNALVQHIVLQINGHSNLEFFCRCRPTLLLREAVQKKLKGWQALELKIMLS